MDIAWRGTSTRVRGGRDSGIHVARGPRIGEERRGDRGEESRLFPYICCIKNRWVEYARNSELNFAT
jgi:hypothetical protein